MASGMMASQQFRGTAMSAVSGAARLLKKRGCLWLVRFLRGRIFSGT